MSSYGTGRGNGRARGAVPVRRRTPPTLPNGKTPGGPKGLPPGLGGAARGQGSTASGPNRTAVVAQLRSRFGKRKGNPAD